MALNIEITFILSCIAILIAVICWGWTTCLILKILKFKFEETRIINSLIFDFEEIKKDISNNFK